jgi:hypothetical protein
LASEEFGLSHSSALNERYFGDKESSRGGAKEKKEKEGGTKSRSLDNLLGPADNSFGLSESRLNQRYRNNQPDFPLSPEDLEMESISQRGGRKERWDDVGTNAGGRKSTDR